MGIDFDYRFTNPVSLVEIETLQQKAQSQFLNFQGLNTEETIRGYFKPKKLPSAEALEHLLLKHVWIMGYLPLKKDPFPVFRKTMARSMALSGHRAVISVDCAFEEKNSKQTRRYFDSASIYTRQQRLYFAYAANGSLIMEDKAYRRGFCERVAQFDGLPIELGPVNDPGVRPYLHSAGGEIQGAGGNFSCELFDMAPEEGVNLLERFVEEFASQKRFEYFWSASSLDAVEEKESQQELCLHIYRTIVEEGLPAQKYELNLEFVLNELAALDLIQQLCGPKDKVFTELFSFDFPEEEFNSYAVFNVLTTAGGHELQVTLKRSDKYLPLLEEKLGIKLEKIK